MQFHEGGKIMHLKTVFSLPCCWHLQFLFTVLLGIAFESITITCIKKMKQTWCFLHRHISLMNSSICWSLGLWSICAAVASSFRQQQGTAEALPSTLLAKPQVCIRGLSRCILFDFAVPSYFWWLIYKSSVSPKQGQLGKTAVHALGNESPFCRDFHEMLAFITYQESLQW